MAPMASSRQSSKNVILDTHQYLMTAEMMGCPQTAEGYDDFVRNTYAPMIAEMSEYFPVIVGEWCLFNSVGCGVDTHGGQSVLNGEEGAQAETLTAEQKRCAVPGRGRIPARRMEQGQRLLLLELQAAHRHRQHPWLDRLGRMGPRALHRPRLVPRPKVIPSDARIVQSNA